MIPHSQEEIIQGFLHDEEENKMLTMQSLSPSIYFSLFTLKKILKNDCYKLTVK